MSGKNSLINLVVSQNNADNTLRTKSELQFNRIAAGNPSQTAYALILSCAHQSSLPIDVKQSCLLHLKRLVLKYWSIGFQLFVGPPIDPTTKALIRESLLLLATSSISSKIRAGSAYVIVQIAAADFPDEWPGLLDSLYNRAVENENPISVMGSLAVLNDLIDDLISETQFWEGGVGNRLITYIGRLLEQERGSPEIKISALKLYLTIFSTLLSGEALGLVDRESFVIRHIKFLSHILMILIGQLLDTTSSGKSVELVQLSLRSHLYQVFARILSSFRRHVLPTEIYGLLQVLSEDCWLTSKIYTEMVVRESELVSAIMTEDLDEPGSYVSNHLINIFETLSIVQNCCCLSETLCPEELEKFVTTLSECSQYPKATAEDYVADFNVFVTDASGLSSHATVRDSIQDFLGDLNDKDAALVFKSVKLRHTDSLGSWIEREAFLFLSESIFSNQDSILSHNEALVRSYLDCISSLISPGSAENMHPLLIARVFLLIPKLLENFSPKDSSIGTNELGKIFRLALHSLADNSNLIMASALISATLWRNIEDFDLANLGSQLQAFILDVCNAILDNSEEDTLPILLEAISVAIIMDHQAIFLSEAAGRISVVDLILRVSFKDPTNVQVSINSAECLQLLLANVDLENFIEVSRRLVPYLVDTMGKSIDQYAESYNSHLYLTLELLGYIVEASPCLELPEDIFFYIFPVLKELILTTSDDQILQSAGEVFNKLMQKSENLFIRYSDPHSGQSGLDILLAVASKFLSLDLSDSAAMNCGLIVITLFERFQSCLDSNFFFQLLEATVRRVVIAKELITVENLIMVFCKLVLQTSPQMLIDALLSMELKDRSANLTDGLRAVLPIWFESFDVTRGVEKLQQNILALGKIFTLGDFRVENVQVDGDLIPYAGDLIITRSKAKTMPQTFTQISAPHKILKLLVSELRFQSLQPDPEDYVLDTHEADDDEEGWEDIDKMSVPNYERLKSYVDSEEDGLAQALNEGIRTTLVQFFKECVSKNFADFQSYYEILDDDEKAVISENVIFT